MNNRRIESFLLRVVVDEQSGGDSEAWRGRIQHVGSGYERQFEHLQEIIAFIREQFPAGQPVPAGEDEAASGT